MPRRVEEYYCWLVELPDAEEFEELRVTRGIDPGPENWVELGIAVLIEGFKVAERLLVLFFQFFGRSVA